MKKIFKILAIIVAVAVLAVAGILLYIKAALPNVGPAPGFTVETNPARVKHGEYLANHITVCIDCHSKRDFAIWSGPITPGTLGQGGEAFTQDYGFPGKFYARNITPENLANWTDGEIYRTITTGVDKNGKALFNVMPYQRYAKMDPEDIKDIIAYIRTLKPVKNYTPPSEADFPVNFILNTIPKKAEPEKRPEVSNTLAYGGYLVNAAACSECHTKAEKGKVVGEPFAGGFEFTLPGGTLRSPNITPDNDNGIGKWPEELFLTKFKQYTDSSHRNLKVRPGDLQTIMPWTMYAGMDSADLKAIYTYLRTIKPVNQPVEKWTPKQAVATL
jgi:mono/diheme cytochrome c family protein